MGALISATEVGWRGLCEVFLLEGEPVEMEIQKPSDSLLRRRRRERGRRLGGRGCVIGWGRDSSRVSAVDMPT